MGHHFRFTRFFCRALARIERNGGRLAMAAAAVGVMCAVPVGGALSAGASTAPNTAKPTLHREAYWLVANDGGIFSFGGAPFYGSMGGQHLNEPIVGMAADQADTGYWEVASDGGIFTFGSAVFHGSMGGHHLNEPIVAMAADPATGGYWEVASDGGIFAFTAPFYGSMGGHHLNKPIVGMAATPTGGGYWLVASDGGIFSFGNAGFFGSTGSMVLNKPIIGMAPSANGSGYWLLASDGGVFSFGSAPFDGSLGGTPQSRPIAAMASLVTGKGYWITNDNGAVTNFGTAVYWGSAPQVINAPVVAMAIAPGNGDPGDPSFQAGAFGYDISGYQCGQNLPSTHSIGIVEVEGASNAAVNQCLRTEVSWAAGGLNLYTFLTYGTTGYTGDTACSAEPNPTACNWGYEAGLSAYDAAAAAVGAAANVPWWLDVETKGVFWSGTDRANQSVVQGAVEALRSKGINTVGLYFSLDNLRSIVGSTYSLPGPLWVAWWTSGTVANACNNARTAAANAGDPLPYGPALLQYTDNNGTIDGDYAC